MTGAQQDSLSLVELASKIRTTTPGSACTGVVVPHSSYQIINIVSSIATTSATQAHGGWAALPAPTTRRTNLRNLNTHDELHMASEMLRQRPTQGGFDAWADHNTKLVTIAQKTIRPHSSLGPLAPGARGSYLVPVPRRAGVGGPPALGGAERDVSHAALLLLQIPVAGLEAQHAGNHQGREENDMTFDAHTGAHHQD
ncbi:hypothetical protein D1007_08438 [Hordeum vulgare]|nr:hypothetical protein D1007_08438 [Hordeum vulgare]